MSQHLRELIKVVRSARTAQEEREVITKELAAIRTACAQEENDFRPRNVAKMLYIHMLGYNTQFGQMECLKLIVSPHYSDKRIGYLGLMILLDEKQEVLMLVTNSLKNDLNHFNQFVVGLALCALGNIASQSIARDTAAEVEKQLSSSNPYIRKKAALCALRILRKVPELVEYFLPRIKNLLSDKNHGVLIATLSLMIELSKTDNNGTILQHFRKLTPTLLRTMRQLTQSGFAPEYDVAGITDPFLQVKLLRLLGILGASDPTTSDQMNDILAQVATNTDSMRNVGNSILYECVQTIMSIESENGLRILAVNILGRFLMNRDNNSRYVALNTLCKVVGIEPEAVQRHRNMIVDCLKDPDISIRRRSLELIYALVNATNVRNLVRELISFLLVADIEFRPDLTARLCALTEQYAPHKRWQVDTILKIMSIAGNYVPDEVCSNLIALIASTKDLQTYAAHKMYLALTKDISQQAMVQVGVWCIGEFGDLLTNSTSPVEDAKEFVKVSETDVLNLLSRILKAPTTTAPSKIYILTALMKLTARFSTEYHETARHLISNYTADLNLELQSRACEFEKMFQWNNIRSQLLDRMPPPDPKPLSTSISSPASLPSRARPPRTNTREEAPAVDQLVTKPKPEDETLINFGDDASDSLTTQTQSVTDNPMDVLNKIFGGSGASVSVNPAPSNPVLNIPITNTPIINTPIVNTPIMASPILDPNASVSTPGLANNQINLPPFIAFQQSGLTIQFQCIKQPTSPHLTLVNAIFYNSSPQPMENFIFQSAVPRYVKLQLQPASASTIPPLNVGFVTQIVKLANSLHGQKPLVMKIRAEWNAGSSPTKTTVEGTVNFPPNI